MSGKHGKAKLASTNSSNGAKRATAVTAAPPARLNEAVFADDSVARLKAEFAAGAPFPHLLVEDVFDTDFLAAVRTQLLAGSYNQRRNDLFEFQQTDDLKTATAGPVAAFRELIYSPRFRDWMSAITGIALNDTIDVSSASYGVGSHLLCHDDDLAERRIAFICYLIPETWEVGADGGSLDLFDAASSPAEAWGGDAARLDARALPGRGDEADAGSATSGASASGAAAGGAPAGPCILPGRVVTRLRPAWNSIAFFEVSALSHHQVAEVLAPAGAKGARLSVSGWFHGTPVPRAVMPTLPPPVFAPLLGEDLTATAGAAAVAGGGKAGGAATSAAAPPAAKRKRAAETTDAGSSCFVSAAVAALPPVPPAAPFSPLTSLLNPAYLKPSVLKAARQRFDDEASIQLSGLLAPSVLDPVLACLGRQAWLPCGPPNMRSYRCAGGVGYPSAGTWRGDGFGGYLPDPLFALFRALVSEEFAGFLGYVTGLSFGGVTGEVRCFGPGDYTLLHDPEHKQAVAQAKRERVAGGAVGTAAGAAASGAAVSAGRDGGKGGAGSGAALMPAAPAAALSAGSSADGTTSVAAAAVAAAARSARWLTPHLRAAGEGDAVLEVTLCLTPREHDEAWAEGSGAGGSGAGGFVTYLTSDDELLTVLPASNAASLVLREPGLMSFVKYITAGAPGPRYDIALQFLVKR
jgi:Rps23 Pro-64 3,4-dihydroxylase Tpa1-like proline 4-hydroxylase